MSDQPPIAKPPEELMPDMSEEERRSEPRIGLAAQVRVHGGESWSGTYETGDVSSSGAFLVSDNPPPRGAMVKLDLELDADRKLRDLSALVVHVRSEASHPSARGCGVMFLRMPRDQADTLREILAERTV